MKYDPQDFIPGYNVRFIELDNACSYLVANGWSGFIPFDEAVKAVTPDPRFEQCPHMDSGGDERCGQREGHDLPHIFAWHRCRGERGPTPAEVMLARLANPLGGLDLAARMVQDYSDNKENLNVSAWLRALARDARGVLGIEEKL